MAANAELGIENCNTADKDIDIEIASWPIRIFSENCVMTNNKIVIENYVAVEADEITIENYVVTDHDIGSDNDVATDQEIDIENLIAAAVDIGSENCVAVDHESAVKTMWLPMQN